MRVLALLFKSAFIVFAISFIGFLAVRELSLFVAKRQIENEAQKIRTTVKSSNEYAKLCAQTYFLNPDVYALDGVQLRFTDATNYVVEAVCTNQQDTPIFLRDGALSMGVVHAAGSPGLFFSVVTPENTFVDVTMWGRTYHVRFIEAAAQGQPASYPIAACSNWGYSCCDPVTEVPDGFRANGNVMNCSTGCYAACKPRPAVLSFRSDPTFNAETRLAEVSGSTAEIAFTGVLSQGVEPLTQAVLEYGDGSSDIFTTDQLATSHVYTCVTTTPCRFTATLTATDKEGLTSPDTAIARITVVLTP